MDNQLRCQGISNQDQNAAWINQIWSDTDREIQLQMLEWMQEESPPHIAHVARQFSDEAMAFVHRCAVNGLRGTLMDAEDSEGS